MEVFDKVTDILAELSGAESISAESRLREDLALDSLQMVTLLMLLEESFQIMLEESDMNPFDLVTVGDVVKLANKYIGGGCNEEEN